MAYKLQVKKGHARPPSIVVKFVSRSVKTEWIYARKLRRSLTADEMSDRFPNTKIYFNEHLPPQTRDLFNAARKLFKEKKLAYVWTSDCTVLVKKSENIQTKRVRHLQDLKEYCVSQPPSDADTSSTLSPGAAGNNTSSGSKDYVLYKLTLSKNKTQEEYRHDFVFFCILS